jgi:hypothetical protein
MQVVNTSGIDSPTNVHLRYNIIERNGRGGILIFGNTGKGVDIYGNLIFNNLSGGGVPGSGVYCGEKNAGDHALRIYNNTFFNNTGGGIIIADSQAVYSTLEIRNNIFHAPSGQIPLDDAAHAITGHSNNLYYREGGGTLVRRGRSTYAAASISSWEPTAAAADPYFRAPTNLPTGFSGSYGSVMRPNTDGLDVRLDSPASDLGKVLSAPYDGSINGVPRPSSGKWEAGAYEHGQPAAPPASPANLRIVGR